MAAGLDEQLFGTDLFGAPEKQEKRSKLGEVYGVPPFTVINSRDGEWQERKRAWIALGLQSDLGRDDELAFGRLPDCETLGRVSIFDPVLCEHLYKWFVPEGGTIIDPFAGGSVRGVVAGLLGYKYWGCDLSAAQIAANITQRDVICDGRAGNVEWVVGDSLEKLDDAPVCDSLIACPPYWALEVYSDDKRDLSNMSYFDFLAAYRAIIKKCRDKLINNRFATWVISDVRDPKTGNYVGLVADTIKAFADAGMPLYNDAVLVNVVGSAAARAGPQFEAGRKLARCHQNILTFVKGDGGMAAAKIKSAAGGCT